MNKLKPRLLKISLASTITLFIFTGMVLLGGFVGSLAGINPDNQGKQYVQNVSESTVNIIWFMTIVSFLASLVLVVFAGLNFKFKKQFYAKLIVIACGILFIWAIYANWALSGTYTSGNKVNSRSEPNGGL